MIGNLEKASETYGAWSAIYSDDWLGFNALANDANLMGRYEVAANAARRTVALEPNRSFGYTNLATALVGMKQYEGRQGHLPPGTGAFSRQRVSASLAV